MGWLILLLIVIIFIIWVKYFLRHYLKNKIDTITAFSGGLGSGKTLISVGVALKLYKKALRKRKFKIFINKLIGKKEVIEKPLLLSNIPIKLKNGYCSILTYEHLTLQERIPQKSIILIDEIGAFADQFRYKDKNIVNTFNEFVRFARHYVDCKIICNDQCSENINLHIRRRINSINNLSKCLVIGHLCFYFQRVINISEEIKTIDQSSIESVNNQGKNLFDNYELKFKFVFYKKRYDTRCYRYRYSSVPSGCIKTFSRLTTNKLLYCPLEKDVLLSPLTTSYEDN